MTTAQYGGTSCDCWYDNHDHARFHCRRPPEASVTGGNELSRPLSVPVCRSCEKSIRLHQGGRA